MARLEVCIPSHLLPCHPTSSRTTPLHPIPSRPIHIPQHPIPSHSQDELSRATWEARITEALLASSEDLSAGEGLLLWPGEWMVQGLADRFGMAVRVWSERLDSTLKYLDSYRLEYALVPEGSKVEGFSSLAVQDIPLTLSCIVTTTPTLTHPYPHPPPHPHPHPHPYPHPPNPDPNQVSGRPPPAAGGSKRTRRAGSRRSAASAPQY